MRRRSIALIAAVAILSAAPACFVLVHSFDVAEIGQPFRFGLSGWSGVLSSPITSGAIGYSFLLAVRIPIAIVVAFAIASLLVRVDLPLRRFITYSLWFAYFLPALPMTLGWILLLDRHYGLVNQALERLPFVHGPLFSIQSVAGIIWIHLTLNTIPIMVILLTPALRQLDIRQEEAARMSGANLGFILRRVTIPLLAPAIIVAFIAGLIKSLEVFEVEQILGIPAHIYVFATRIYDLVTWNPPLYSQAMALGSIFLVLMLAIAWVYQAYLNRIGTRALVTGRDVGRERSPRTWWAYLASGLIVAYISIGVFMPLAVLILGSFTKLFGYFTVAKPWTVAHWTNVLGDPSFSSALWNSLVVGTTVGALGCLAFAWLAWIIARERIQGSRWLSLLTWLPWAIPGILLGIGFLPLVLETPVLSSLYRTLFPLTIAMFVAQMPIGVQMFRTSITGISTELEDAAILCGWSPGATFVRITLPLIAPMIAAVFMLIFVATIRDISTVILLATPGTQTLSLLMFQYAVSNSYESASVLGVIIALISLGITALVSRVSTGLSAAA